MNKELLEILQKKKELGARIERAKILLKDSEYSVQEVSDKLGFTTRNYFTRCFRELTGMTPMEYRNAR